MATLFQRYYLKVPYQRARTSLEQNLREIATSGQPQLLRLRLPVSVGSNKAGLEKDVIVTFGMAIDPLHFDQPWHVQWKPHNGGPYPDFSGTLTVRADDDYDSCVLELQGTYEPPFGVAGAAFDAVVGSRVASATAREFLRTLSGEINDEYRREESSKENGANVRETG